jgi:hypothetical protein
MNVKFEFYDCSNVPDWDAELLEYDLPHVFQSSSFAENFPNLVGRQRYYPKYIYICDSGAVIGQCLIGLSRRKTIQWYFGPVVKDEYHACYNDIVEQLIGHLQLQGVLALDYASTQIFYERNVYSDNDSLYSHIGETCFVDLGLDCDEIYGSFDSSVRKNVRKCNRAGVTVDITNDPSVIPVYLEMLSSFRRSRGFPMPPFYPNMTTMKLHSRAHTSMAIAFASVDGLVVSAMGYVTFGKLVTEIAAAQSAEYLRLKLPVNDLIKVRAIEHYKSLGMKYYDITGGKKYTEDPKERNINKFKRKFGIRLAEFGMIQCRYTQSNSFKHVIHLNTLKVRQTCDRCLAIPSKVRRMIDQYCVCKLRQRHLF